MPRAEGFGRCEDCAIMFQESQSVLSEGTEQIANRELMSIDLSLETERKMLF